MRNILFVKYNNLRSPEFQIATTIYEEDGVRIVEKSPCCDEAVAHVVGFQKNYELLKKAHRSVSVAEPVIDGNVVKYEFFTGKTLEDKYQEELADVDTLLIHIRADVNRIYDYDPEVIVPFKMTPEFERVFGDGSSLEGEAATLAANVDLAFDNIMQQDDRWILIDYEWVLTIPVPVSFLRYRSVIYFWNRHYTHLIRFYTKEEYLVKVGMDPKYMEMYDEMEERFQQFVRGEDWKWHVLKKYEKPAMPFERYMGLVKDLEARDASIEFLNDLVASKDEYISGLEQLMEKYHNNPAYKVYNALKKGVLRFKR